MAIFSGSGRMNNDEGPSSSSLRRIGGDNAMGEDGRRRASNSTTRNHDRQCSSSQGNSVTKRPRSPLKRSEENDDSSSYHSHKKKKPMMNSHNYRILLNEGMKRTKNSGARRICRNMTDTDTDTEGEDAETTFSQLENLERPQLTESSEDLGGHEVKGNTCSVGTVIRLKDSSGPIQRDHSNTVCIVCNKQPGIFLRCGGKGCNKNCHIACFDPRLGDSSLGSWLCFCCLRKKMEFGVYSISEGYESIWDAKEEMQKERQYLVKHRGLAHVYNQWIPESKLLLEDPALLARFKKLHKKQVKMWNHEWKEPHRLLQKRFVIPPERAEECACGHGDNFEYCYLEWFVKWKGLGYEHSTWEFENSPFLCSVEGKALISDYGRRHEEAKIASSPSTVEKVASLKGSLFNKLPRLPDGFPSELGNDHLDSISSILNYWHKNQNAVLIDDQDRIVKSVLFLLNLLPYTCQPFLIISTNSSISMWEAEFIRLAPSLNVVAYNGNREVRKMIQTLEFYEEGGCIMLKVLLTSPHIIVEDLEAFDCIGWEAIIVDDCQKSSVYKHFEEYAELSSKFRLLLLDSPPKDIIVDYFKLLSFLDPKGQENPINSLQFDSIDSSDSLSILKERLKQYTVYECERKSSKFLEYWVPVQLSEVQLGQYCSILASNSLSLRLPLRADCVEPLLDVLMSIRKCCHHPYLADDSLEASLTKTSPPVHYLDVGVNASGKLQLLDRILQEVKNGGLRVLILLQSSVGSERNRLGDILYDFLHQRFGDESFEYVDSRLHKSQTEAILQKFNEFRREKFVIVIENRACRPRIKLSSVDAVIIYDSDWNPMNDLKALRKITIDSPFQQLKIFRLYSPYTVEEKLLILTKEHGGLEVDIENTKTIFRHSLLSWGALYLFSKFDESQELDSSSAHPKPFTDNLLLNDVLDLLTQSPEDLVAPGAELGSNIVKARLIDSSYSRNITLRGEKEGLSSFDGDPILFWSKLLGSCSPKLRSTSRPSPRIRRSTQCLDESARSPEEESFNEKKSRKVGTNTTESLSRQTLLECRGAEPEGLVDNAVPENVTPCCANQHTFTPTSLTADADSIPNNKSGEPKSQPDVGSQFLPRTTAKTTDVTCSQQSSGLPFNPEVHTFMEGEIKGQPGQECSCTKEVQKSAIKENQSHVSKDQGRSNIEQPIHQKLVDKNRLFAPGKGVPEYFFQEGTAKAAVPKIQLSEEEKQERYVPRNDISKDVMPDGCIKSLPGDHEELEEGEIREEPNQSCSQTASMELISLKAEQLKKNIDLINTVYGARIDKLIVKQIQEVTEFKNQMEKQRQQLLRTHGLNMESIRPSNLDMEVSDAKKKLHQKFSKKLERFDQHVKFQRKKLTVMQIEARNKEKQLKEQFLENAKMGTPVKSFDMIPLTTTGFSLEKFKFIEQVDAHDDLGDATTKSEESIQCHRSNIVVETAPIEGTKQMFLEKQIPSCKLTGPITVESAEQDRITSDISAVCQSVGQEDELLATRTPSSQCKFSSETAVLSTESPEKKRETAIFSPADTLIQITTAAFQCNNSSVLVVGSAEASSESQPILPREDHEDIIVEKESLGSQLNCVEAMKSVEPSRTSPDIAETLLFGEAARAHNNLETKIIASDDCDGWVDIAPGTTAERCGDREADGACFTSSLQSEAYITSLPHALNSAGCKNSASHGQADSLLTEEGVEVNIERANRTKAMVVNSDVVESGDVNNAVGQKKVQSQAEIRASKRGSPTTLTLDTEVVILHIRKSTRSSSIVGKSDEEVEAVKKGKLQKHVKDGAYGEFVSEPVRGSTRSLSASREHGSLYLLQECQLKEQRVMVRREVKLLLDSEVIAITCKELPYSRDAEKLRVDPLTGSDTNLPFAPSFTCFCKITTSVSNVKVVGPPRFEARVFARICTFFCPTAFVTSPDSTVLEYNHDLCSICLSIFTATPSSTATIIEMEIPAVSGTPREPVCSSSPDLMSPVLVSDDRGLVQVDHNNQISEDLSVDIGRSNNVFVQDFTLPVPPAHNELPENTRNQLRNTTVQPETVNILHELLEVPQPMPEQGTHSDDPFLNEISSLRYKEHLLVQTLEDEKRNLALECERELDEVRKKYALRVQDADTRYHQKMKALKSIQGVVQTNQCLAEDFREKFIKNKQGMPPVSQGEPSSSMQQQLLPLPRPRTRTRTRPVLAPPFRPAATPLFSSPRMPTPVSIVTSSPILVRPPTNLYGRSEPRLPAPHLRPMFRPRRGN